MKLRYFLPFLLALAAAAPLSAADTAAEARKIKLAYAQKLDQLLAKAKYEGDTAATKEIEAMIAQVEGKEPAAGSASSADILKPLLGTWQRDHDNGVWKFNDTKSGTFNGNRNFTMSYDPEKKRVVVVGDNWVNYLTFTNNADQINGSSEEENGRTRRYKLTRVK